MDEVFLIGVAGWLGVIFYVSAYFLLTIEVLKVNGYLFHSLNILGATGLIIDSAYHADMPNLVVNAVWFVVGVFAVIRRYILSSR